MTYVTIFIAVYNSSNRCDSVSGIYFINTEKCVKCGICEAKCPFDAITFDDVKKISQIQDALCKGCGGCVPVCPVEAIDLEGYTNAQVRAMIDALVREAV